MLSSLANITPRRLTFKLAVVAIKYHIGNMEFAWLSFCLILLDFP